MYDSRKRSCLCTCISLASIPALLIETVYNYKYSTKYCYCLNKQIQWEVKDYFMLRLYIYENYVHMHTVVSQKGAYGQCNLH